MTTWAWDEIEYNYPILRSRQEKDFKQHRNGGWVERTAKVTRSIIADGCLVLGKAIVDMCELKHSSMIRDNAEVIGSLLSNSTISDRAKVERSIVVSSKITDDAILHGSSISCNSIIQNDAIICTSTITDGSVVIGNTVLSTCHVLNARVNVNSQVFLTEFKGGLFTEIPITINDQLTNYNINIDKEKVAVGCIRGTIDWWKENVEKVRRKNFSKIKEKDIDRLIEAIKVIQEVYDGNLERNG